MGPNPRTHHDDRGAAFTITELLVAIAITGVLVGVLTPSLASARKMAWQVGSNAVQRDLVNGLLAYTASNDEWIPGVNTSGLRLWNLKPGDPVVEGLSRRRAAAVQNTDWISPSMAWANLPEDREQRFYEIFERFADPAMPLRSPVWLGGGAGSREMADWVEAHAERPTHGVSFLMPMNFQLYPGEHLRAGTRGRTLQVGQRRYAGGLLLRQTRLPDDYLPKATKLGNASNKIALADGFRYLDLRASALDFDASYAPFRWGSFADRSPLDMLSRSWGRRGGGGDGDNLPLVYRHSGLMDAAFWDGHVQMLDQTESRNPALWTPTGSVFIGGPETDPDAFEFGIEPAGSPFVVNPPARSLIP